MSPSSSSADHTMNTLRYADRIKERVVGKRFVWLAVPPCGKDHLHPFVCCSPQAIKQGRLVVL